MGVDGSPADAYTEVIQKKGVDMISLSRRVVPAAQILLLLASSAAFAADLNSAALAYKSFVTHFAKQVHWDGSKDEEAWLIIVGEGPATLTRVEEAK